jgi:sulfur-oxidizing protein SoxZ
MARALINVPPAARRGEVIEIKAMAAHDMETGFRRTQYGKVIPRNIITTFVCTYNGAEIFSADFHPAISANPYVAFSTIATESGTIACTWTGDNGYALTESVAIRVD